MFHIKGYDIKLNISFLILVNKKCSKHEIISVFRVRFIRFEICLKVVSAQPHSRSFRTPFYPDADKIKKVFLSSFILSSFLLFLRFPFFLSPLTCINQY